MQKTHARTLLKMTMKAWRAARLAAMGEKIEQNALRAQERMFAKTAQLLFRKGLLATVKLCMDAWSESVRMRKRQERKEALEDAFAEEEERNMALQKTKQMKTLTLLVNKNSKAGRKVFLTGIVQCWHRETQQARAQRKRDAQLASMQYQLEQKHLARMRALAEQLFYFWYEDWVTNQNPDNLITKLEIAQDWLDRARKEHDEVVAMTAMYRFEIVEFQDRELTAVERAALTEMSLRKLEEENHALHKKVDETQADMRVLQRELYDEQARVKERDQELSTVMKSLQAASGSGQTSDMLEFGVIRSALANCLMLRAQNMSHATEEKQKGVIQIPDAVTDPENMKDVGGEIPTPLGFKSAMGAPQAYGNFGVPGHGEQFAMMRGPAGARLAAKAGGEAQMDYEKLMGGGGKKNYYDLGAQ
jgi:hypothetical protein